MHFLIRCTGIVTVDNEYDAHCHKQPTEILKLSYLPRKKAILTINLSKTASTTPKLKHSWAHTLSYNMNTTNKYDKTSTEVRND